jgi:hypothetical protein
VIGFLAHAHRTDLPAPPATKPRPSGPAVCSRLYDLAQRIL